MGRGFYLYLKNGIYLAELIDPITGLRVAYRSTGTKNRDEAVALVSGWLRDGIPNRKKGRSRIFNKPESQSIEAVTGLAAILKSIEKTADLDETGALEIAKALKKRGLLAIGVSPFTHGGQEFINYLREFWDFDNSPYLEDQRMRGKSITQRTCRGAKNMIEKYWLPHFKNKTLVEVTRADLRKLGRSLRGSLSGKSIKKKCC